MAQGTIRVFFLAAVCFALVGLYHDPFSSSHMKAITMKASYETTAMTMEQMKRTVPTTTVSSSIVETTTTTPKKFYVIHIGPSKTGTSAIQQDLGSNPFGANTMEDDNLIYVGRRHGVDWNQIPPGEVIRIINGKRVTVNQERKNHAGAVNCMMELLEDYYDKHAHIDRIILDVRLETDEDTRASLRNQFAKCWKPRNPGDIDSRYMLRSSIVDSDEVYSYTFERLGAIGTRYRLFDILGYDRLIVVGAYRRYAEWLASTYGEVIKQKCLRPNLERLLLNKPCRSIHAYITAQMKLNDPNKKYGTKQYLSPNVTLPQIAKNGPSKLETKLMTYYRLPNTNSRGDANERPHRSITTELYCDAFGMELTPHTCRHAENIERDASSSANTNATKITISSLVINKGSTSDSIYQNIVATAYELGFLLFTHEDITKGRNTCNEGKQHSWCPPLQMCIHPDQTPCQKATKKHERKLRQTLDKITSFGRYSIVGTNTSTVTTWKDLTVHHTQVYQKNWMTSLPIQCPERPWLEQLLQISLEYEEVMMPDFYATPLGKEEHTQLFWDVWLEQQKLFCWVDTDRLFQNATSWDEIINHRMVSYDWSVQ